MDASLFYFFNSQTHPIWLDNVVLFWDFLGKQKTLLGLTFALTVAGFILKKKTLWQTSLFLFLALFCGAALVTVMKTFIPRPRPFFVLKPVYVLSSVKGYSFPSGHATLDAVLGAFLIFTTKKMKIFWIPFWLFFAFVGGVGRIYQGVHYPSDVLGGWILGGLIGWAFYLLYRRSIQN